MKGTNNPPEMNGKKARVDIDEGTDVNTEELPVAPAPVLQKGRQNIAKRDLHRRRSWNDAQNKRRKIRRESRVASQEADCAEDRSGQEGDDDGNA